MKSIACAAAAAGRALALAQAQTVATGPAADVLLVSSNRTQARLCEHVFDIVAPLDTTMTRRVSCLTTAALAQQVFGSAARQRSLLVRHFLDREPFGRLRPPLDPARHADALELVLMQLWEMGARAEDLLPVRLRTPADDSGGGVAAVSAVAEAAEELADCYGRFLDFMEARGSLPRFDIPRSPPPAVIVSDAHALRGSDVLLLSRCFPPLGSPAAAQLMFEASAASSGGSAYPLPLLLLGDARLEAGALPAGPGSAHTAAAAAMHAVAASALAKAAGAGSASSISSQAGMMSLLRAVCALSAAQAPSRLIAAPAAVSESGSGSHDSVSNDSNVSNDSTSEAGPGLASGWSWSVESVDELAPELCSPAVATALRRLSAAAAGAPLAASKVVATSSRGGGKRAAAQGSVGSGSGSSSGSNAQAQSSVDLAASIVDSWPFAIGTASARAAAAAASIPAAPSADSFNKAVSTAVASLTAPLAHAVAYSQRLVLPAALPADATGQAGAQAQVQVQVQAGDAVGSRSTRAKGKGKARGVSTSAPTSVSAPSPTPLPTPSSAPSSSSDGFMHVLGVAPGSDGVAVLTRVIAAAATARSASIAARQQQRSGVGADASTASGAGYSLPLPALATLPPVVGDLAAAETIGVLCKSGAHVRQVAAALQEAAALAAAHTGSAAPPFVVRSVSGLRLADVLHVRLLLAALRLAVSLRDAGDAGGKPMSSASNQQVSAAPQLDPAAATFAAAVAAADGDAAADSDALFLLLTGEASGGRGYGMPPALFRAYARAHAAAVATGTAGIVSDSKTAVGLESIGSSAIGFLRWMAAQEAQTAPPTADDAAAAATADDVSITADSQPRKGSKKADKKGKGKNKGDKDDDDGFAPSGPASRLLADLRAATVDLARKRSLAASAATLCRRMGWHRLQADSEAAAASDDPDAPAGSGGDAFDDAADVSGAIDGLDAGLGLAGFNSAASARARAAAAAGVTQAALAALLRHLQEAEAAARTPRTAPPTSLADDFFNTNNTIDVGPDAAAAQGSEQAHLEAAASATPEDLTGGTADLSGDGSFDASSSTVDSTGGSIGSIDDSLGLGLPCLSSAADGSLYVPPTRAGSTGPSPTLRLRPDSLAISASSAAFAGATVAASASSAAAVDGLDPDGSSSGAAADADGDGAFAPAAAAAASVPSSSSGRGAWRAPLSPAALLRGVSRLVFEEDLSLSLSQAGSSGGGGDGISDGTGNAADGSDVDGSGIATVSGSGPQALGSLEDALCAPDVDVAVAAAERIAALAATDSASTSTADAVADALADDGESTATAVRRGAAGSGPQVVVVTTLARASALRFDAAVFAWLPEATLPGTFRAPQLPAPLPSSVFRVSAAGVLGVSQADLSASVAADAAANGTPTAAAAADAAAARDALTAAASVAADFPPFPLDRDGHAAAQRQRFAELVSRARLGVVALAPARLSRAPATSQRRSRFLDEAFGPAPAVSASPPRTVPAASSTADASSASSATHSSLQQAAYGLQASPQHRDHGSSTQRQSPTQVQGQAHGHGQGLAQGQAQKPLTLSVSRLGDYMWCPQRYFLGRSLALHGAPTAAVLYGRALHSGVEAGGAAMQAWLMQFANDAAGASSAAAASADIRSLAVAMDAEAGDGDLAGSAAAPATTGGLPPPPVLPRRQWDAFAAAVGIARHLQAGDASSAALASRMLASLPSPQALASLMRSAFEGDWTGRAPRRVYPFGKAPTTPPSGSAFTLTPAMGFAASSTAARMDALSAAAASASYLVPEEPEAPAALLVPAHQALELRRAAATAFTRFATAELQDLATALQVVADSAGADADAGAGASVVGDAASPAPASMSTSTPVTVMLRLPAMVEAPFSWWRRVYGHATSGPQAADSTSSTASSSTAQAAPEPQPEPEWLRLIGIVDRVDLVVPLVPGSARSSARSSAAQPHPQPQPQSLQLLIREFKSGSQWKGGATAPGSGAGASTSGAGSMAMTAARHLQLELYADALRSALADAASSAAAPASAAPASSAQPLTAGGSYMPGVAAAACAVDAVAAQVESPETGAAELLPAPAAGKSSHARGPAPAPAPAAAARAAAAAATAGAGAGSAAGPVPSAPAPSPRYEATVARVAARLRAGDFTATPSAFKCAYCSVQAACAHAVLA